MHGEGGLAALCSLKKKKQELSLKLLAAQNQYCLRMTKFQFQVRRVQAMLFRSRFSNRFQVGPWTRSQAG